LSQKSNGVMLAIDTNLIIRYLTRDHPEQSARARALIDGNDVFVCNTVFMETEWVLRSVYGFAPTRIADALTDFAGLPHVTLENPIAAAKTLDWMTKGVDFADALHLATAHDCDAFVSFDKAFAKAANALGDLKVRAP
jgi:predicted nucleic acid-binding protein